MSQANVYQPALRAPAFKEVKKGAISSYSMGEDTQFCELIHQKARFLHRAKEAQLCNT